MPCAAPESRARCPASPLAGPEAALGAPAWSCISGAPPESGSLPFGVIFGIVLQAQTSPTIQLASHAGDLVRKCSARFFSHQRALKEAAWVIHHRSILIR